MDRLFSVGKKLFSATNDSDEEIFNPLPLFKQLDRNGDGKITEEDFVLVIEQFGWGSVGENAIRGIFQQIDTNKNGSLEFTEALSAFDIVKSLITQTQKSE